MNCKDCDKKHICTKWYLANYQPQTEIIPESEQPASAPVESQSAGSAKPTQRDFEEKALSVCINIFDDFDAQEIKSQTASVRLAWEIGRDC